MAPMSNKLLIYTLSEKVGIHLNDQDRYIRVEIWTSARAIGIPSRVRLEIDREIMSRSHKRE